MPTVTISKPSPPRRVTLFLKLILSFFTIVLIGTSIVSAQKPLGTWNILNAKYNFDKHLSIWTEGQLRSIQFIDEFFYYEAKAGINYSLKDHITVTAAIGHYATYTLGGNFVEPLTTTETRTWLQLIMEQKWDRINFEHRYRIEQRHLSTGYKNRIRYRLNAVIPINHPETSPKTIYAYIGDEIFIGFTAPFYERNRFYAGLGYKFTQVFTIQSGYIRQYDYKLTSELSRHFLQTALFINLNPEDLHKHSVPSISD